MFGFGNKKYDKISIYLESLMPQFHYGQNSGINQISYLQITCSNCSSVINFDTKCSVKSGEVRIECSKCNSKLTFTGFNACMSEMLARQESIDGAVPKITKILTLDIDALAALDELKKKIRF